MTTPDQLPRVTYSNIGTDFTPVHDMLDGLIPEVRENRLGGFHANRIAGQDDTEGDHYAAPCPINRNLVLGAFVAASAGAVGRAVDAAANAFPDWAARPWRERVALLRRAADLLDQRKYDLAVACLLEVGKSRLEAIGEAEEAVDLIRYYCDQMEARDGFTEALSRAWPQEETTEYLRPLGVFGVIAPFNFPLALSCNMLSGALVTGNTVVYKPSPMAGLTGALLMKVLEEAGLPTGVVNMVCGGEDTGAALTDHPRLAGVVFTGSHKVGMSIYRKFAAGPHARPVILEMGGKNPTYVTARADLDLAAEGVMRSAFGLQGQKCSACSKVYVEASARDGFLDALLAKSRAIQVGDPARREVFVGPVINNAAANRFQRAAADAAMAGRVLLGGGLLDGGEYTLGHYAAPTIVAGLPAEHGINKEELFLPFLSVLEFDDLAAAIADGNAVNYGLTAGIYTDDEEELQRFLHTAQAGALYANRASGATTGAWPGIQTFCGWKGTGVTNKGGLGPYYLPQFMREQSHTVMRPGRL